MAIDTSLFINLIAQFKDKGIKDAQKGFKGLLGSTNNLNKGLGVLARRVAVFETLRRSFKAFVEDDAAARRLNQTLNNLGLAFSALSVEDYLNTLEKATAVNNDQLRPSFETLARVTGDFTKTQDLLNTSLDVAAGTGQSVTAVSRALARAYAGNTTSLSRLNAGLSKATLATGNFELIQDKLNSTFAGQAADQVDTYQGKIERLKIAFQDAGDAIGKGMVDGLTALGSNDIQNTLNFIVSAGEKIGSLFAGIGKFLAVTKELFSDTSFFQTDERRLELLEKFRKADDPANIRTSARVRRLALEQENRAAAKIARTRAKDLAAQKKAAADLKKIEQDKLKLSKAESLFDDDRITIAAALTNESLDRNEILRLELKKAIINENADRAEILAGKLKESQKELGALAAYKLANPFQEWEDSLSRIRGSMASLGVPVAPLDSQGKITGKIEPIPSFVPPMQDPSDPRELTATERQLYNIEVNVAGNVVTESDLKKVIVDTVVEASTLGYSTGWFRTTGQLGGL